VTSANPVKTIKLTTVIALMMLEFLLIACLSSIALSQTPQPVYNSLMKSRDALLDQRRYLQAEADRLNQQMLALQKQLDVVGSYLRDNDRAIKDVDNAIRRAQ
jgi:putative methionine-R-sulfoxide reductase with GAF domain